MSAAPCVLVSGPIRARCSLLLYLGTSGQEGEDQGSSLVLALGLWGSGALVYVYSKSHSPRFENCVIVTGGM